MHRAPVVFACMFVLVSAISANSSGHSDFSDSRVYVPWEEFKGIIDRLSEPESVAKETVLAPVDYLLTSADVKGVVAHNKSARFMVQLQCTVLPGTLLRDNGWISIPLGAVNSTSVLEAVRLQGKPLPLTIEDNTYRILLSKAGTISIDLTYDCTVSANEGTNRIELSLPKTMATNLDFAIPDVHAEVAVNGCKTVPERVGNGLRVTTAVTSGEVLQIEYTPLGTVQSGDEDTGRVTPRVYAATGLLVDIKENQIRYQYRVDYQIWHKKLTSFAIALPDTYAIEEVVGAGISHWSMERKDGKPVLTVRTNFTPVKEYSLTVKFSRKLESTTDRSRVPSISALSVHRESGCIAVAAQQTMEVSVDDSIDGVTAIDQSELHPWMQGRQDLLMRFKYINPPFTLFLNVKRHSDMPVLVAIADNAQFTTLLTSDGYVLSKIRYQLRNNHKQYLRVKMESGWHLWSALIDGGPVMPASAGDNELLVPLRKMSANDNDGGFTLELVYWKEWKKMGLLGRFAFGMPVLDVNIQRIDGDIWVPKEFSYGGFGGSLQKTATYIGSGDYVSTADYSASNVQQQRTRQYSKMANQQMGKTQKGLALTLPVEITVPTGGVQHRFTKSLTVSGEKVQCTFSFRKALPDFGKAFGWVLPLAFLIVGFVAAYVPLQRRTRKSIVFSAGAAMVMLIILEIIKAITDGREEGLLFFITGIAVACIARGAFASKKGAAGLLLLFCLAGSQPCYSQDDMYDTDDTTELGRSTVAIPWSDFKGILDKIKKPVLHDTGSAAPPVSYVISSGDYRGYRLNEQQFEFSVRLTVSVLERTSWIAIPLMQNAAVYPDVKVQAPPSCTAAIGAAPSDDNGINENKIVVKGAGTYEITYRFAVPVTDVSGVSRIEFPMPLQATASIDIELDKQDYRVTANEMPLAPHTTDKGHTWYTGAIGAQQNAVLSWYQEVTQISAQDAMLLGTVNTFYSLGMGLIQMRSEITLKVIHQDIHEFTFSLPRNTDIIDVTGTAVLTWERVDSVGSDKRQNVKVLLKYRVRDDAVFNLTAEQTYGDSVNMVLMPDLLLNNATRQEGFAAIGVTSNIELEQNEQSANVLRKDRRELPAWFEAEDDLLFAYQYLSGLYSMSFNIKRHENVSGLPALVERAYVRSVVRSDGKTITELTMNVKNRGEQFVRFRWNAGWQLWSLYCNNNPARPSYDSAAQELLVPLEKAAGQSAITAVKLVYLAQNRSFGFAGKRNLELPSVNIPLQNISYDAYVPSDIDIIRTEGNLHPTDREKQMKTPWFSFAINPREIGTKRCDVATDFYEKMPDERCASMTRSDAPQAARMEEEKLSDKKTYRGGGGDARARVTKKGMLGSINGQIKGRSVADADIFGKGGNATNIDAILQGTGSLKAGGGGNSAIGYGTGYGGGEGGVDELIGQRAPAADYQLSSSSVEAGQLSLPIEIAFDGKMHSFQNVLLKAGEHPSLSFFYRKLPLKVPFLIHLLLFLLTAVAGAFLAVVVWSGWNWRATLYGILIPCAIALVVCRLFGISLGLDWVVIVPLLFLVWRAGVAVVRKINNFQEARRNAIVAIEAEATKKSATVAESTPVQQETDRQNHASEGGTV